MVVVLNKLGIQSKMPSAVKSTDLVLSGGTTNPFQPSQTVSTTKGYGPAITSPTSTGYGPVAPSPGFTNSPSVTSQTSVYNPYTGQTVSQSTTTPISNAGVTPMGTVTAADVFRMAGKVPGYVGGLLGSFPGGVVRGYTESSGGVTERERFDFDQKTALLPYTNVTAADAARIELDKYLATVPYTKMTMSEQGQYTLKEKEIKIQEDEQKETARHNQVTEDNAYILGTTTDPNVVAEVTQRQRQADQEHAARMYDIEAQRLNNESQIALARAQFEFNKGLYAGGYGLTQSTPVGNVQYDQPFNPYQRKYSRYSKYKKSYSPYYKAYKYKKKKSPYRTDW